MILLEYNKISDEDLAELVIKGDNAAFATLVKRHVTRFYKTAFMILRSKEAAEDVVQDCFLKFWEDPQKWDSKKAVKFITWFSKVITNKCYDNLKKFKEEVLSEDFEIRDNAKLQDKIIEEEQVNQMLQDAYLELSEKQQMAISLSFFEGKKNFESAKIMGLTLKAFQSLLIRSKDSLRENFKKLYEVL